MPVTPRSSVGRLSRVSRACRVLTAFAVAAVASAPARADVKLHELFTDHMVLQRGIKAPVWGTASPGEKINIVVGDEMDLRAASGTAGPDGAWRIDLPVMEAGGPFEVTISGKNKVVLQDVLVGDVWICSGQSNMEFGLQGASSGADAIKSATLPKLRLFTVVKRVSGQPCKDLLAPGPIGDKKVALSWAVSTPESARGFSAVGFFFGRQLQADLEVPIGLIHTSWGGTPAEAWTSDEGLKSHPALSNFIEGQQAAWAKFMADVDAFPKRAAEWAEKVKESEKTAKVFPPPPTAPADPRGGGPGSPSTLYNGMIAPLLPFAIKGAIWYQGESNAGDFGRAVQYGKLFPAMITDWRKQWGQGDFPFFFVQLANWQAPIAEPVDQPWAFLRESQLQTLSLPKTGMASAIDIGDTADIHPRDKETVGRRLALAARAVAYGQKIVYSGPIYESMAVERSKIRLKFRHVGGGLVGLTGAGTGEAAPLRAFSIAGKDGKFVWAKAEIEGETVVVSAEDVKEPTAARYDWAANPNGNLYNKEGLPASPFRTDAGPPVLPAPAAPPPTKPAAAAAPAAPTMP
ncbi:MAG: sialate O-acetylesterase [Planctomycetota bacterium]|nr:sialate O-acetylesterase [Planctomycetota bacterium]